MNKEILSEYAPELFEALKNLLDEIPIIAGDSRHDALAMRIYEATSLIQEITDAQELEPCPFCGGKAIYEYRTNRIAYDADNEHTENLTRVICSQCGVSGIWRKSAEIDAMWWNRRVQDA